MLDLGCGPATLLIHRRTTPPRSTNEGAAMGRGYLTVGDLIAELSGFDPNLPIKMVISDAEDEPHSDAVLKRLTCLITRLSNSGLGGGERGDVLLLKCMGLYE